MIFEGFLIDVIVYFWGDLWVCVTLPPLRGGCQARGVVVRCERLRCTRLQHRTCKTRRGHFASHGLSAHGLSTERARLAGGTSLRSWFQKKCLLPSGILIFFPKNSRFLKSGIFRKKIKIPIGSRHFFWNHERSEVPPASLARSVLKPCAPKSCEAKCLRLVLHVLCWSRMHLSRVPLTTTPLFWQPSPSGGNVWVSEWSKKFLSFFLF